MRMRWSSSTDRSVPRTSNHDEERAEDEQVREGDREARGATMVMYGSIPTNS